MVGPYLVRLAKEGVSGTTLIDDVSDQVLLSIVGGEDADAVGGVAQESHVHVQSHAILRFPQVLHQQDRGKNEIIIYLYIKC